MKKIYALFSMKKQLLLTFVCTLLLGVFTLNQSFAQAIWSDSFDYAAGSLLSANGWTAHSGEGTNPVTVSAGSLSYLNYEPSNVGNKVDLLPGIGEDVNHSFPSQINSGTVYAAFMINVTEAKNTGDYFAHFMGQNNTTFGGKVFAKASGAGHYKLGITKFASPDSVAAYGDAVLDYGTTCLVVLKYTIVSGTTNDQVFLFINPVVGSPEPATPSATAPTTGTDPNYIAGFALRQGGASTTPKLSVDGIRVASTWDEAVKYQGTAPMVATPLISPNGGLVFTPQTVTITCTTPSSTIRYTLDGNDPTETSTEYTTSLNITSTTTVKAKAWAAGLDPSYTATNTYTFPVEVANIAAFKAVATKNTVYKITGDVTFVYKTGRYFYIKDATAGLLIYDDTTPVITNSYNNGDIISGGVLGKCDIYNGVYELIPTADLAPGTSGTPVQPITLTMANLLANFDTYESQLVKLSNVNFAAGTFGTGVAGNIKIYQDEDSLVCRNNYGNITGYVTDPDKHFDVTGFAIPYNADRQIAPRELNDIKESSSVLLSGTVTIAGAAVFGETLTATANLTSTPEIPDLGEITYQWMRGGAIVGSNSDTYTLTQSDIGGKISVTVTAENCSGSVSSAETETVSKATQTAPEAPELESKTPYSITLTEISGCEYRMDGGAWQTSNTFNGLTPETTYSFEARKAETETHFASDLSAAAEFTTEPLGVNDNELNKIQVYSFRNSVYVNKYNLEIQSVKIFDMIGRLVYQNEINKMETVINLQVNTGIYHVVLQDGDGIRVTKVLITK